MIHALAQINVQNPDKLAAYREKAGAALAKHGGAVVQASGNVVALEGAPNLPQMAALLSFPNAESAQAWINDPDLADVHALRNAIGTCGIVMLG